MRGHGLRWARRFDGGWPLVVPKPRPRRGSAKALGLAYERALAEALGDGAQRGVWWEFEDAAGRGWCQTDLIVEGAQVLVLEVKYSWLLEAHEKLAQLYVPVVQMALGKPAFGLVVARRLMPGIRQAGIIYCSDLKLAAAHAKFRPACLHWLGPGHPLMAQQKAA